MCDDAMERMLRSRYLKWSDLKCSDLKWSEQYTGNRTKRERLYLLLANVLDKGEKTADEFDRKTDAEIKRECLQYADELADISQEILFTATNIMIAYSDNEEEETMITEKYNAEE